MRKREGTANTNCPHPVLPAVSSLTWRWAYWKYYYYSTPATVRPPATCAGGANSNDNKVKPLAAGSVCFPVSAKGALACALHSRCFGNSELSIRPGLCRGPVQQEMLSLAVTNDCRWWFWGRKSCFQIYPILPAELQEPHKNGGATGLGLAWEPSGWWDLAWCSLCHTSFPIFWGQLLQSCTAPARLELSNYRELSIWSGLLLVGLILLSTALLTPLCSPHLAWGGDGQLPVGAHCFSELIWEGLIQFSDKYGEFFHWFQWLLEWSLIV